MIHQGKLQLVINALQKELAIAIRNHQPIYCGKAALFWQDFEIWDVMDCGGLMKWNSQGENTEESEERAGNGDGGAMEKRKRHGRSHHRCASQCKDLSKRKAATKCSLL